ncbi:hypothetical protein B5F98_00395 [Pseudoflavonifractor sp. An44]|uniref:hypothetical protein n=1 Tax=Pseudoflavonifractor sp. An44 TaxID=1965635 RepID=UPI000B3A0973|nr:hypothetical protein [Pseudoflavonifractor sp. An44]OUN99673.1 hypothetical protein B5F98_00395 [Pseudoflavonifractor sp. An44]
MKAVIFIDDNNIILERQKQELNDILTQDGVSDVKIVDCLCDLSHDPTCLNDDGSLRDGEIAQDVQSGIRLVLDTVQSEIDAGVEKLELVIDLCLDDKDETLGFKLASHIIRNKFARKWFEEWKLVITLTSSYKCTAFSELKEKYFSKEDRDRIIECYRPYNPETHEFTRDSPAFPMFYHIFHTKGDNDPPSINRLLLDKGGNENNKGTYYGNYFGLIYARLYYNKEPRGV